MAYYSALTKKEVISFAATWMELEVIKLSEVKSERVPHFITYMWNINYGINEPTKFLRDLHRSLLMKPQGATS